MPSESLIEELASMRFRLRGVVGSAKSEALRENIRTLVSSIDARGSRCSDEIARELLRVGDALLSVVAAQNGTPPASASK